MNLHLGELNMTNMRSNRGTISAAVVVALVLGVAPAHAALITFIGADDGAGSLATAPNSVAAAGSFDAAVGALGCYTAGKEQSMQFMS